MFDSVLLSSEAIIDSTARARHPLANNIPQSQELPTLEFPYRIQHLGAARPSDCYNKTWPLVVCLTLCVVRGVVGGEATFMMLAGCIASWSRWMTKKFSKHRSRIFQRAGLQQVRWWEKSLLETQPMQLAWGRHRIFMCVLSFKVRCMQPCIRKVKSGVAFPSRAPFGPRLLPACRIAPEFLPIYLPTATYSRRCLPPPTVVTLSLSICMPPASCFHTTRRTKGKRD